MEKWAEELKAALDDDAVVHIEKLIPQDDFYKDKKYLK